MASFRRASESDRVFAMPLLAHIALMLALAVVLAFVLGFGLWWGIGRPSIASGNRWTAKEGFDFIKIVLALVGGTGAVVALVVSYRKQRIGEEAETREDARLFGEDFARATEQLGSAEAPVRLAGMYTLERLGQNTPKQQQTIVNVLCAYLRMPYTPPETDPAEEHRQENERRKHEREVRLTAQRILATSLRPGKTSKNQYWKDIHLDLTGATLLDFDLHDCQLDTALFTGAQFSGDTRFTGAKFSGYAEFEGAEFNGNAGFSGAEFNGDAWFDGAEFSQAALFAGAEFSQTARFEGVEFSQTTWFDEAQFSQTAWFEGAQFSQTARFDEAQFSQMALFVGAQFSGNARFDAAQFSGNAGFEGAQFSQTAWFAGAQFSGNARFEGAEFSHSARFDEIRVRLDVPKHVRGNRTWPQEYAVTEPTSSKEARLPGREGKWGYLVRADAEENDTHRSRD